MYLVHFSIARWLSGDTRGRVYISGVSIFHGAMSVWLLSFIIGLATCLTLEFPMTALLKEAFRKKTSKMSIPEDEQCKMNPKELDDLTNNNNVNLADEQTKV